VKFELLFVRDFGMEVNGLKSKVLKDL